MVLASPRNRYTRARVRNCFLPVGNRYTVRRHTQRPAGTWLPPRRGNTSASMLMPRAVHLNPEWVCSRCVRVARSSPTGLATPIERWPGAAMSRCGRGMVARSDASAPNTEIRRCPLASFPIPVVAAAVREASPCGYGLARPSRYPSDQRRRINLSGLPLAPPCRSDAPIERTLCGCPFPRFPRSTRVHSCR